MRGEYFTFTIAMTNYLGSPPLAWGIRLPAVLAVFGFRITPTCVGNTYAVFAMFAMLWDHPHLRGEYAVSIVIDGNAYRITPTCVGNTPIMSAISVAE